MANPIQRFKERLKRKTSPSDAARTRARRRKAMMSNAATALPYVQLLLALAGFLQFAILPLPLPQIARRTYIDENAVQPGQVNTYFNWPDVSNADRHAETVGALREASSEDRSAYFKSALLQAGLPAATQAYSIALGQETIRGINTYAMVRAPKASGGEIIVLAAPWKSREAGMVNVRGVSSLLALAKHLQKLAVWSKDIVILFSDGDLDGLQAWLHTYHAYDGQNIVAEPIESSAGSIWTAMVVDYPFHSFSHIGVYYDGIMGRLPNLDLVNSAVHISRWVGGVPVRLHNQTYTEPSNEQSMKNYMRRYGQRARGLFQQTEYGMTTRPSGPEGLFGQYGIDAVGLFAVPADGPHGFYTIGRIVESLLRTANNVVERLHASYFLYLLPEPFQFLSVASYLSAPILIGASLTFAGLRSWHYSPAGTGLKALVGVLASYLIGLAALFHHQRQLAGAAVCAGLGSVAALTDVTGPSRQKAGQALMAFSLLSAGMVISVATILNYGLGAALSILTGVPLLVLYYTASAPRWLRIQLQCLLLAAGSMAVHMHASPFQRELSVSGAPLQYAIWLCLAPLYVQILVSLAS